VHESGHAIAAALSGKQCLELAVAPVGATEDWSPTTYQGQRLYNLAGYCTTQPASIHVSCLVWDAETAGGYNLEPVREVHDALLAVVRKPRYRASYYRGLRSSVCELLAGLVAEGLLLDRALRLESDYTCPDDINKAEACCNLLPFRNEREFDHAAAMTAAALREHWPALMSLAAALANAGTLAEDDIRPFLPEPLDGWPTPPPRRMRT